ncbi:nitrate reductase molybdenum cofactor assembly chaperone [Enterococcus sp. CSURQ0835]|uniref:nitrate reductase molybdenum cofactor assembly chaperone n=1 Tax=Enterococcus sp. CSURQ0835 TaxID=2681394 RepID=UPI00135C3F85|nr:nitrate reductase molybdenum cofactor assembly chaperone [Enterococcus sp. CSURQ0835]
MIDTKRLTTLRPSFLVLSQLLDFPEESTVPLAELTEILPAGHEKTMILTWAEKLAQQSLQTRQEQFTHLFELNKQITLYCTYYRFKDGKERGVVLAKLKMLYEMFGVTLEQAELTDYLPVMLEFLAVGQWQADPRIADLQFLFSVLEDGTYELLQHAKEYATEPYIQLIREVRNLLKSCVKEKVRI